MCSIMSTLFPSPLINTFCVVVVVVAVAELVFTAVAVVVLDVVVLEMRFLIGLPPFVGRLIGANVVRVDVVVVVVLRAAATAEAADDVVVVEDAVVARLAIGAPEVGLEIGARADGL